MTPSKSLIALSHHTSSLLENRRAQGDHFTLDWLVDSRPDQSYGIVVLFLSILSMIPGIDIIARLLLMFIAMRAFIGYSISLPDKLMRRPLPIRYLAQVQQYAIPLLHRLEKFIYPRWPMALHIRRYSAIMVFVINLMSLIAPLPLINMPPAAITFILALAYLEHDGVMLIITLIAGTSFIMTLLFLMLGVGRLF